MSLELNPVDPAGSEKNEIASPINVTEAMEGASDAPKLSIGQGLTLPGWVSSNSKQDVILTLDSSISMRALLAQLDQAVMALWHILASEENKNGFRLSIIRFSDDAELILDGIMVQEAKIERSRVINGTNFDRAVEKTYEVVGDLVTRPNPDGWMWLRPQVLFLSDGHSRASQENINRLHEVADVWSIAYGAGANLRELSRIASDGQAHVVGTNGGELRRFLANVGETLSAELMDAR